MPGFRYRATAWLALALALVGAPGCSGRNEPPPSVSADELQRSLIERLAQAGTPSTWVNCPKDLAGRVGAMTRCEVRFSQDDTVTAVLTTTEVSDGRVNWEITGPELTRDQVTRRVAALTAAQAATCDSSLDGRPGDWVQCQVTRNGVTLNQAVEVKEARGLALDLVLTQAIPKQQLEDMLLTRLTPQYGRRPDGADCVGDLPGVVGSTVGCVVTVGDNPDRYVATVTGLPGGVIDFDVTRPSGKKPDGVDRCPGCAG